MNSSNVKIFFRTLKHNKLYAFVTIFGFAFSLTFIILLTIYIQQELSVDQFHEKKDRLYRAVSEKSSHFGALIGEELKNKYPEIESYTRLYEQNGYVEGNQKEKIVFKYLMADSTFFTMFSFPLLEGDPQEALKSKNSVVLTRSYARKIFGNQPALGQEVILNKGTRLLVTGVMEDMPQNTHFNNCDGILAFPLLGEWIGPEFFQNNNNCSFGLYFLAKPGAGLASKAPQVLEYFKENFLLYIWGHAKKFYFEPITATYFGGKSGVGVHGNSKTMIFILSAIVVAILILSLINYNNLSVAQAGFRAKETAIKKLLGSQTRQLFFQFITESVILCLLSFVLALFFCLLAEPVFNDLLDTHISIAEHFTFKEIACCLVGIVLLGGIAGATPAFVITRFHAVDIVKGAFRRKSRGVYGKTLICFQYTIAIMLIVCTLIIMKQNRFMQEYNLGFDLENVVWLSNRIGASQKETLRDELKKIPEVVEVCYTTGNFLDGGENLSFVYKDKPVSFQKFRVDLNFFSMMNIQVTPTGTATSSSGAFLNKVAVKTLELEELPATAMIRDRIVPILGITDDFHFRDLTEQIGPVMIQYMEPDEHPWTILVKIAGNNPGEAFRKVQKVYGDFIQNIPFESGFADQTIQQWYEESERTSQLIGYFSLLAVTLSMMGILAMATFYIQQRLKEIGLRRINGGTVKEMTGMLLSGFLRWIIIAFVIACPLAWYIMNQWLSNFAYRTGMSWWIFVVSGLFACLLALLMVGWQSYRAATTNPVNILKNE